MKKIYMLIAGVTFTLFGYSQTQPQVEKQIQDPKRRENAGKADVIIADKKAIFDSTTFNVIDSGKAASNQAVKAGTRKKHCGDKTKRSSKGAPKKKA